MRERDGSMKKRNKRENREGNQQSKKIYSNRKKIPRVPSIAWLAHGKICLAPVPVQSNPAQSSQSAQVRLLGLQSQGVAWAGTSPLPHVCSWAFMHAIQCKTHTRWKNPAVEAVMPAYLGTRSKYPCLSVFASPVLPLACGFTYY